VPTDHPTDDRLRIAVALLASAMMAAPLWVGRFLPLLDLPQHLAITTVLLRYDDPAWLLAAYFEPQRGEFTPYWAHYLALEWLGHLMPVDVAARAFLSLYVFALPWAAMALARALGRPPALGLFAIPLSLNANVYYGFIAYCWSVVALLWALALLARQLDAPRAARAAGLGLLAGALFFTHVQSFAFLLLAAAVLVVIERGGAASHPPEPPLALRQRDSGSRVALALVAMSRRALRAWPLAPATVALFLPWLYLATTTQPGTERYFPYLDDPRAKYEAPLERLAALPAAVAGSYQDGTDNWLLAAWAMAVAAAAWSARPDTHVAARGPDPPAAGREPHGTPARSAVALTVAAVACYFALPVSIQGQWNIAQRFAWTAALLLPCVVRATPRWLPAATLALAAATAANAAWHHARFDREAAPFDRALATLRPGARVLGLIYDSRGQVLERWPYLHFEQYAVVHGGGMAAHSFTANAPLPVRLRPRARGPEPRVWHPGEFRYDEHGRFFDFFLIRDPTGRQDVLRQFAPGSVDEVFRGGAWRVYRGRFDFKPRVIQLAPGDDSGKRMNRD